MTNRETAQWREWQEAKAQWKLGHAVMKAALEYLNDRVERLKMDEDSLADFEPYDWGDVDPNTIGEAIENL